MILRMILLICLFPLCCFADNEFVGEWDVEVVSPVTAKSPYQLDVKYPKWMKIEVKEGQLSGRYIDQYGGACSFPMIESLNGGKDLLFVICGTTKNPDSYAPVHHAKIIGGRLKGIVFGKTVLFEWMGAKRE